MLIFLAGFNVTIRRTDGKVKAAKQTAG